MSDRTEIVPPAEGELRSFGSFIAGLEDGELHHELTESLAKLNEALNQYVLDHGGTPAAKLSLAIGVTLVDGQFEVRAKMKLDLPLAPRRRTILWGTAGNRFSQRNPRQADLFAGPREIRSA